MTARVIVVDFAKDEIEEVTITDTFAVICDGTAFVSSRRTHPNGTTVLTIKGSVINEPPAPSPRRTSSGRKPRSR